MGRVEDGVVIWAGTCALGNIRVQNNAKIGARSRVLKPVPAGSAVAGNPARLIGVELNAVKMVPKLISVVTSKRVQNDAKIDARSMVLKPVSAGSTAVGNPARLIGVDVNPVKMQSIFIPFKHSTSTNAACIRFLFKHSTSTKATYYETGFPCLSSPLPIHVKNSKSPGVDLWLLMKEEVKLDVEQEPLLSKYYLSTILAHNSMEGALANSLSLKLSTYSLPSDTLYQLFLGVLTEDREIMEAVIDDLRVVKEEDPARKKLEKVFFSIMGRVGDGVVIRVGTCALANIRVQNEAKIGAGSMVLKPVPAGSTVVEDQEIMEAVIDDLRAVKEKDPASISHGQKLEQEFFSIMGRIGDGVVIRVGTCSLGNIRVQNNAKIGSESMVLKSVQARSTVVGNLARLIGVEGALENSLSLKLSTSSLPSDTLYQLFFGVLTEDQEIVEAVIDDLRAVKEKDPASISQVQCFLNVKGFFACQCHRIAHDLWAKGRKALALLIQNRVSEIFAIDIHPGTKIGKGIFLDHGMAIVIGETSVIGNNVTILHNVMLGGTGKVSGDRHPKIGDGVVIGAGTCVFCNIRVQNDAKICAVSMVLKPVPTGSTVVGNPARLIGVEVNPFKIV
ncbi:hypothetical protein BUALT_Bualt18G0028200 [Buddleja alternifolia]|uniref:serine O-acetyltransferase n=1 Tax=Buddleja alternifolia TaxID=168488 RepID=A0AAV6W1P2_9LAMI|nr:hypothetical protein BUALT_Bualt18G0028200 [Buddleja alternifolia]